MKKLAFFVVFLVGLWSCNFSPRSQQDQAMGGIIEAFESLNDKGDKYKKQWTELDSDSLAHNLATYQSLLEKLDQLPVQQLSEANQINRDLLVHVLEDRVFHLTFKSHLFPLNAEGGFLTDIIYDAQSIRLEDEEDYENYLTKLKAFPSYIEQRIAQMKEGQAAGKSSPKLIVKNCLQIADDFLAISPSNSFFIKPVEEDSTKKLEVTKLVELEIVPAYKNLKNYLEKEYLVKAPEAVGISAITEGKAFYEQRVKYYTTFDISPKEVFDVGQGEVERIKGEMQAIIDDLGFKGSFADFLAFLRTDPQFYPKTKEELMYKAAWITKEMEGKLPDYFGKFPRMPLAVNPVPEVIAPNYTTGRYSPGSYDNHKPGEYWVNTYNLPSRPFYVLPALSLHEGVPGHHLQIMLAAEIEDVPKFRKNTYLSAYGEGWGLYAEFLGQEADMYKTPYEKFGRLTYEMWRACRLVVDPGMHYMGWTRQEAFDFMASNTALSLHEVNTEINRYIGWPGQAVSYKMGELKIRELRQKAEKELGDKFNIRDFHDKVLENGSIPLNTLERVIDGFIEEVKALEN